MQFEISGEVPSILFVDDEPTSRKWFALEFGDEFKVVTAGSADEALQILGDRSSEFGVLVTDHACAA
jgi:CheY-like chemotaxis protein